jgi:hypothetical protein
MLAVIANSATTTYQPRSFMGTLWSSQQRALYWTLGHGMAANSSGCKVRELGQLKGQMAAVEQASIAKKCNIQFQAQRPPQ